MYAPESPDSMGGHRLIRKADFHLGQHNNCLWRVREINIDVALIQQEVIIKSQVRAKLCDPSLAQCLLSINEKRCVYCTDQIESRILKKDSRHVTWFATLDCALGHLLTVAEKSYR